MKKRIQLTLSVLFLIILVSGCTYYSTLEITPVSESSVQDMYAFKKHVIVHAEDEKQQFWLTYVEIDSNSIRGTIQNLPIGRMHKAHDQSFRMNNVAPNEPLNTMHLFTNLQEINKGELQILFKNIKSLEIHEKNDFASNLGTVFTIIGASGVAALLITFVAVLTSDCACPMVESYGAVETHFHGSLFPGAIFKSLKRDDYLMLDNAIIEEGQLKLRVYNNLPEIEFIDELNLLEVSFPGYKQIGVNSKGEFVAFNIKNSISSSNRGESSTLDLKNQDEERFEFADDVPNNELNSIEVKIDRKDLADHAQIVIRGKQSRWLESVANFTFYKTGKSFKKWVSRKDDSNPSKWKKKHVKQGIALNIYVKNNGKWKYLGSHHDAGTLEMRNLLMPIQLADLTDDVIELKLESAYRLWEIDYVGLTDKWTSNLEIKKIPFATAVDENGEDVKEWISKRDKFYHTQNNAGTFLDITIENVSEKPDAIYFLHGHGYYHHIRKYDHKADLKALFKMNRKFGIQKLSKKLYYESKLMEHVSVDN